MPHKLLTILLIASSLFYGRFLFGQEFIKRHINYENGLTNGQITSIKQNDSGYIWIGTNGGGVFKWDGKDLKPLSDSLKYEIVREILPAKTYKNSSFWMATVGSLFMTDQKHGIVELPIESYLPKNCDWIQHIFTTASGVLTISLNGSINLLNNEGAIMDSINLPVTRGGFKAIHRSGKLHLFNREIYLSLDLSQPEIAITEQKPFDSIFSVEMSMSFPSLIHAAKEGWWMQNNDQLLLLDYDFKYISTIKLPFSSWIAEYAEWEGYYWFATDNGLYRTKLQEDSFLLEEHIFKLRTSKLLSTRDGLWAGTVSGLYHFSKPAIALIDANEEDDLNGYFAFAEVVNEIWAGSFNQGIHIYQNSVKVDSIVFAEEPLNAIRCFLPAGDSIWIGTSGGLVQMDIKTREFRRSSVIPSSILSAVHFKGQLVFSTARSGIFVKKGENWSNFNIESGLRNRTVWSLLAHKDTLFIGTEHGVNILENGNISFLYIHEKVNQLPVTALEKIDDETIAIGYAQGGVVLYNLQEKKVKHHFEDYNGLSSSYIYLLKLIEGKLWVGSNLGIDIVDVRDPYSSFQVRDLAKLAGAETFLNGIIAFKDKAWVSTIAGTISIPYHLLALESFKELYPVQIEQLEPLSFALTDDFRNFSGKEGDINIPYGHGSLKIHFNVPHFSSQVLNFSYKMEGYDPEISEPMKEKFAVYKQLPAGDYTFKVWRSISGKQIGEPAQIAFSITLPFYRTLWFRALLLILFIVLVISVFAYRARLKTRKALQLAAIREEAQNELRQEMALDFHDEMGNHLAKIINLSGVLKMWGLAKEQDDVVQRIERAANALFTSTKDMIWSLKKENNNLEEVYFHVKDFAEQVFENTEINLRSFKNESAVHFRVNAKAGRDLSLILKEAITNIYKHAKAKNVDLRLDVLAKGAAQVTVADDGIGFACEELMRGNGLKNMKQRAARSGFEITLQGNSPEGTTVIIEINSSSKS